VNFNKF